jgi:hypothetical protein
MHISSPGMPGGACPEENATDISGKEGKQVCPEEKGNREKDN